MAVQFNLSVNSLIHLFQVLLIVGPPAALVLTRHICVGLQGRDLEIAVHGIETGRVVRLPDGGYIEDHRPVNAYRRRRLAGFVPVAPAPLPDTGHRLSPARRLHVRLTTFFDQDRLTPSVQDRPLPLAPGKQAIRPSPKSGADQQT